MLHTVQDAFVAESHSSIIRETHGITQGSTGWDRDLWESPRTMSGLHDKRAKLAHITYVNHKAGSSARKQTFWVAFD